MAVPFKHAPDWTEFFRVFQKAAGLTPDGVVGPRTFAALRDKYGYGVLPGTHGLVRLTRKGVFTAPPADLDEFLGLNWQGQLSLEFVRSVVGAESGGNPLATSSAGYVGLFQLGSRAMHDVWSMTSDPSFGGRVAYTRGRGLVRLADHYDPYANSLCGLTYLSILERRVGALTDVTAENVYFAYVFGLGNLRKWLVGESLPKDVIRLNFAPPAVGAKLARGLHSYRLTV